MFVLPGHHYQTPNVGMVCCVVTKIAYKFRLSGRSLQYLDVNNPSSTTTDVTGLGKFTEYSFQVMAYTVMDGPLSDAKNIRTQEDGKQLDIVIYLIP